MGKDLSKVNPNRSLAEFAEWQRQDVVHLIVTAEYVTLNWIFYDKNVRKNILHKIHIPKSIFVKDAEQNVDYIIMALKEKYGFTAAEKTDITFWKVSARGLQ